MKEATDREKERQRQVSAGQNRKALQQLGKLLANANAERLRDILTTDTVTEFLEHTLRVNVSPFMKIEL